MNRFKPAGFICFILVIMLLSACDHERYIDPGFRQTYSYLNQQIQKDSLKTAYLKVHLKDGSVYLLDSWNIQSSADIFTGSGKKFNLNRTFVAEGEFEIPVNTIALMETNNTSTIKSLDNNKYVSLSIITLLNAVGGILCLTNPKACFGSCPTFYIDDRPDAHLFSSDAEGFSDAVAPHLERWDLDALQCRRGGGQVVSLTMKNEAQETHAVNAVNLLAVPVFAGQHIFHDKDNIFYQCGALKPPIHANGPEGSLIDAVEFIDDLERRSFTDSIDLTSKEVIELEFDLKGISDPALVINFRQTLLTTYLLYTGFACMGDEMGDILARMSSDDKMRKALGAPFSKIGRIEVWVEKGKPGNWIKINEFGETGPIAWNLQAVPLDFENKTSDSRLTLKLVITKGLWRIDYLAITDIIKTAEPVSLAPLFVRSSTDPDTGKASAISLDDDRYIASLPGDAYELGFVLPGNEEPFELFLLTKGYYLEWSREEWLKEKDIDKLKKLVLNNRDAWKQLAAEYKAVEGEMESVFWDSKLMVP